MKERHALVRILGKVGIIWAANDSIMGKDPFFDWYSNDKISFRDENGEERSISKAALSWNSARRRQFDSVEFRPKLTREAAARRGVWNLRRGFSIPCDPSADCSLFLQHLLTNVYFNDHALYRWVLGWFAHLFQHPDQRKGVSLVLCSTAKGTGKSFVADVFGHLLGSSYFVATQPRHITGNLTEHLERTLLLHSAEGTWAGNRGDESVLKSLITDPPLAIERKGYPTYQAKNFVYLLVTTNSAWAVPASADEHRYAVVEVGEGRKQDRAYFGAIKAQLEAGGYVGLLHELLSFDLSTVDFDRVPARVRWRSKRWRACRLSARGYSRRARTARSRARARRIPPYLALSYGPRTSSSVSSARSCSPPTSRTAGDRGCTHRTRSPSASRSAR